MSALEIVARHARSPVSIGLTSRSKTELRTMEYIPVISLAEHKVARLTLLTICTDYNIRADRLAGFKMHSRPCSIAIHDLDFAIQSDLDA